MERSTSDGKEGARGASHCGRNLEKAGDIDKILDEGHCEVSAQIDSDSTEYKTNILRACLRSISECRMTQKYTTSRDRKEVLKVLLR